MKPLYTLLLLFLIIFQSCKKDFPISPTIILGKINDENGLPIEDLKLGFSGVKTKGLINVVTTFLAEANTDKDGIYLLSRIIPNDTERIGFSVIGNQKYNLTTKDDYVLLVFLNNQYQEVYKLNYGLESKIIYGQTNTFNFQIKKR